MLFCPPEYSYRQNWGITKVCSYKIIFVILILSFVYSVDAVGIAHDGGFLCPGNPIIMYPGEERDISFRLQNSHDADERVRIKIENNDGNFVEFDEGDYTVKAKTYDKEIIFHTRIPETAILGEKYNFGFSLFNIPNDNQEGGISFTTSLGDSICVQVGEHIPPAMSPEKEGMSNTTWIILGLVILIIIVLIIYLIKRKKR